MFKFYLTLSLFTLPYFINAQENTPLRSDTLRKVTITKQAFQEPADSATPVQALSKKKLGTLNSTSVADAIKFFSGVQVRDYGGIGGMKTIEVRSLNSNHSTIFYNGIAINNAQNGQVDLGKFSLDNIESITLFNGQQSSLLLPAKAFSSTAALNLESQMPLFEEGKKSIFKAGVRLGDFGLLNPSFLWQQQLSDNVSLSLSSEWTKAHGRYDFYYRKGNVDTLVNRENTDLDALRLEATVQGVLKDSSTWKVTLYNYDAERGLPGAAIDNRFYSNDRQWDQDFFVQGNWKKRFNKRYTVLFNTKYNYSYLRYFNPDFNSDKGLENKYQQHEKYFSLSNLFVLSSAVKTSLSVDYLQNALDANLNNFAYPTRNTLLVNAAVEWKYKRFSLQANSLLTNWNEHVKVNDHRIEKRVISPSIAASWQPFVEQGLYVRAFYKSIFRAPTFNDTYYTLIGSANLQPEYVNQYNVGFTWRKAFTAIIEQITLNADVYNNRIKNKITTIPMANLFSWTMVNLGRAEVNGLDVGVSGLARPGSNSSIDFGVNYTFQKSLDKTPNTPGYDLFMPYSPRHSSSFFLASSYKRYGLNYNALYVGERYSLRPNTLGNLLDSWLTQNLSVSYQGKLSHLTYKLLAEVNNITNTNYTIIRGYPMPGRNYRFGFQVLF